MELKQKVASIIQKHEKEIAARVVDSIYSEQSEVWEKYGEEGRRLSIRDTEYHLSYLTEAVTSGDSSVFSDYVEWVKKLFAGLNLPQDTMRDTMHHMNQVVESYLDSEMSSLVTPVFDEAERVLDQEEVQQDAHYLSDQNPHGNLAKAFNQDLLQGDRKSAYHRIMKAVESGVPVQDLYLHVFQPSQYEIGRRWLANEISVAKEHFASAATQQIMSQLYPYIFNSQRVGKSMVAATVGGELHEMGIRMVADFFEMEGWDTWYLGANTPLQSLLQTLDEYHPDLVALSAAMPFHRSILREFIQGIRNHDKHVKIMVGGKAIKRTEDVIKSFAADGYAVDALGAVEEANKLVS